MSAISVDIFSASFSVETEHGSSLEFVLDEARLRNRKDYTELLWDMLKAAVEKTCIAGADVPSQCCYGHLKYTVDVWEQKDLKPVLDACADAAQAWIRRYRVNSMVPR